MPIRTDIDPNGYGADRCHAFDESGCFCSGRSGHAGAHTCPCGAVWSDPSSPLDRSVEIREPVEPDAGTSYERASGRSAC